MKIAVWMDRGKMVRAAMGEIPCDLTVYNIQLVNTLALDNAACSLTIPAHPSIMSCVTLRINSAPKASIHFL